MDWKANGTDIIADFETSCSLSGTTLTIGGISVTTDGIAMTFRSPL